MLYVPIMTQHADAANGRYPVFKVSKQIIENVIKQASSGSASSMRPKKKLEKMIHTKPATFNTQYSATPARPTPHARTNRSLVTQQPPPVKEKIEKKEQFKRDAKAKEAAGRVAKEKAEKAKKSRKSVVRLVKKDERKSEKLPKITNDIVAVKEVMDEADNQKRRVQALIHQATINDPLSKFNNYPAIEPKNNGFPKGRNRNSQSPVGSLREYSPARGGDFDYTGAVEHVQIMGLPRSNDFQVLVNKNSPTKV